MKAPLSKEIAKVLRNDASANKLISTVIRAREANKGVAVTVDGKTQVYRSSGSYSSSKAFKK
ncbi:hypothetical protein [Siphonobacter sp. SORGH_AS_1065]|uniref:hypothetical protein n=1 Tax=Siphonobacter sp. SORGH_AS_1065 TaxID=3041795 RepID=UPI00277FBFAF|nr:hypothetical protein [Siphonobacter sp. SORGH_AS_1065]MDQ1089030.1 hypothetical protein [Siphonobacter sp. SORGH_AS_1065]